MAELQNLLSMEREGSFKLKQKLAAANTLHTSMGATVCSAAGSNSRSIKRAKDSNGSMESPWDVLLSGDDSDEVTRPGLLIPLCIQLIKFGVRRNYGHCYSIVEVPIRYA